MFRAIEKLFSRSGKGRAFDAAIAVPGRVYAIGDVHGSARLLDRLVERIAGECRADGVEARLVLMGDYVDRGDDSRAVLDRLASLGEVEALAPVLLRGNHEAMLVDVVDGREAPSRWLRHGGLQTLLSYGVRVTAGLGQGLDPAAEDDMRAALAEAMGPHLDLLRGLRNAHSEGNVLFAHAGADPSLPLAAQPGEALIWGVSEFLETPRSDGAWVVHGHYIVDEPSAAAGRIAVDTGAYFSNRLTAARIEGGEVRFLTEALDA